MVLVEKADNSTFRQCMDIMEEYFDVYVDHVSDYNLYKRRYKNKVLQFIFGFVFSMKCGYVGWKFAENEFEIYGDPKLFMEVAQEIEKIGVSVTIKY